MHFLKATVLGGFGLLVCAQAVMWRIELSQDQEISQLGRYVLSIWPALWATLGVGCLLVAAKAAYKYVTNQS